MNKRPYSWFRSKVVSNPPASFPNSKNSPPLSATPYASSTLFGFEKRPVARTPMAPLNMCTGTALTASSIRNRSNKRQPVTYKTPAIIPVTAALQQSIVKHPDVTETSPANAPFMACGRSHARSPCRPVVKAHQTMAVRAPVAAATVVLTAARFATIPVSIALPSKRADPPLKPYHPNQRTNVPSSWKAMECPRRAHGSFKMFPSSSWKRPCRGPRIMAAMRAVTPPHT
mmetsp:Transcript_3430/g.6822  ORF Transcript_3430/g.6822 Transcript_3430/m.6822 type:complete len:229 (-) Transcript_3430:806-1492(-)